jgi:amino-acid N-acetyltransferase
LIVIEKAKITDVPAMHKLINSFADKDEMLHRPLSEIYESIRDYFVAKDGETLVGCAALHVNWSDLAEIRSVAVAAEYQKKRVGFRLVMACVREAKSLGLPIVFCLTYKPGFFEKLAFSKVDKMQLPQKVWNECYRCAKFPTCDEVALVCHPSDLGDALEP